jgi:hypothetical protein
MTPHKHAEAIRAWADGAIIEVNCGAKDIWSIVDHPSWALNNNYRVAFPPKPDQTLYFNIGQFGANKIEFWQRELCAPNLAATFDGETFKLKSVEVLK